MNFANSKKTLLIFSLLAFSSISYTTVSMADEYVMPCELSDNDFEYLLEQVRVNNTPQIRAMEDCNKSNRTLFARIIDINPEYFQYASDYLKDDDVFIGKFAAQNPEILKYISPRLANDRNFMFKMARIYPDAVKYAGEKLTNNKGFMIQVVKNNPINFTYASERLQDNEELALMAVRKNGKMLKFASPRLQNNKQIVAAAIKSYNLAINYASGILQKNHEIQKLANQINYKFLENFDVYLKDNYSGIGVGPSGSRGYHIVNIAKNFPDNQITYHPYITKWEQIYQNGVATGEIKLVTKSNNDGGWKADFAAYPELVKEIENIFSAQKLDPNTVEGLNTISLWEVSKKPKVLAFDLYLLRQIDNRYVKANTSNVVALSAIARETVINGKKKWEINIADAIYDADVKMSVAYENGHRRYKIWDLYTINKKDKNPKVLFKVEDKDGEYFDLYAKQIDGHYASVYKGGGYEMDINIFENIQANNQ